MRGHLLRERSSIRGVAAATCVVVALTGLTVAVHAVASEPDRHAAAVAPAPAVSRIADLQNLREDRARVARASRGSARVAASGGARVDPRAIAAASPIQYGAPARPDVPGAASITNGRTSTGAWGAA